MSEEKKNAETEVVKEEARELSEEELEKVNGGMITGAAQMNGAILVTASDDISAR